MTRIPQCLTRALTAALLCAGVFLGPVSVRAAGVVAGACGEAELEAALAGGGAVSFDCGATPVVITITREKLVATDTVIDGGGRVTLRGTGSTRLLRTADGTYTTQNGVTKLVRVTLKNITLDNGVTTDQGGAVRVGFWNQFTAQNVTFTNNRATKDSAQCDGGGALFIGGGSTALIESSAFSGNRANNGGAINSLRTNLSIRSSTFEDNHATHTDRINGFGDCGGGGAVYVDGARNPEAGGPQPLVISQSRFRANTTNNHGAGLFVGLYPNEAITIERSLFDRNITSKAASMASSGTGGAIWYGSATGSANNALFTLRDSTLTGNQAVGQGGGLWTSAAATISNVTFHANRTEDASQPADDWRRGNGGALAVNNNAAVSVTNATFAANYAGFNGGAIAGKTVTLRNTLFAGNTAGWSIAIMQHCTDALTDGGNNMQWPPKNPNPNYWNETNCTAAIRLADPRLGSLAENGGDTPTIAPAPGSPAIDAGNPASCSGADQRGFTRIGPCDIGAFEVGGQAFQATTFVYLPRTQR
jgi:predicted outer membrane repeat protein